MKFCFVILHYLALNDTIECVDSIRTSFKERDDWHIIIVDNFLSVFQLSDYYLLSLVNLSTAQQPLSEHLIEIS